MDLEKKPLLATSRPAGRQSVRRLQPWFVALLLVASVAVFKLGLILWWLSLGSSTIVNEFNLGDSYLIAARRVLSENPLIDGHNDLAFLIRYLYGNHIGNSTTFQHRWEEGGLVGQLDIPRIKAGQMGGAFWSAFINCPSNVSDFSDSSYAPIVRATLEQIDLYHRLSDLYPTYFPPTLSTYTAAQHFENHRLISPIAIEGLHQIGNSVSTLRLYHALGVRYATLTWNCHNRYADAALIDSPSGLEIAKPLHHGVSHAGRRLIHEMNRLGMLVDLSHVSADTMRDVLRGSSRPDRAPEWTGSLAPPIFSHSSAYALCPHPRNVPDDILHLVAERGGLVMINFSPDFISCRASDEPGQLPVFVNETSTLAQVASHIVYVGELVGWDHVGIGSDFDGIPTTPRGLEGVDKFPDLVAELLRRGVSEADAGKVVGRNVLRVWRAAEEVSERLRKEGKEPLEDEIGALPVMAGADWGTE